MTLNNAGPSYYITRTVKTGGQGAIYEGVDALGQVYAIKEMLDNFATPQERQEGITRFEAEARLLERLVHPRIPRVYVHFKDEGRYYLVMDFVRGEDLESYVQQRGALSEAQVLRWADQICDVLQFLHSQRPPIIFRDLKPSNIMVQADGTIKLIDFGIAKVLQSTQRGTQIGTPGYAPPEQYQGLATVASDVYALCATLHHLLTGRDPRDHPPFTFPQVRDLNSAVSQRTSEVIAQGLQMKPENRFHTIAALRTALLPPSRTAPAAQPSRTAPAAPPAAQRQPAPAAAASSARPGPASVQARPAPPVAQQAPTVRAPRRWAGCAILAVVLALGLLAAVFVVPLTDLRPSATPTPRTLVEQTYTAEDLEILVSANADLKDAFAYAFEQKVHEVYGDATQIRADTITYVAGPEQTGTEGDRVRYRASVQGTILVPQT